MTQLNASRYNWLIPVITAGQTLDDSRPSFKEGWWGRFFLLKEEDEGLRAR
jgi:hypothetical protein